MALTDSERPQRFSEIIGQERIIKVLRKIIDMPSKYPHTMIFNGPRGSGKTTTARAFYNELKLIHKDVNIFEFKSVDFRKADAMDGIKNLFDNILKYTKKFSVVILNEFQLATPTAQSLLLETLEDNEGVNAFFIFTTTNISKLLDTIISRCIEFNFQLIEESVMIEHLRALAVKHEISITDEDLSYICKTSHGHMREAVKYLDYYGIDKEAFFNTNREIEMQILEYIKGNSDLQKILVFDVGKLYQSLNFVMLDIVEKCVDKDLIKVMTVLEKFMMFKNIIVTIEDFKSVMMILRKLNQQTRLV